MSDFTDFFIRLGKGTEIEFRHTAETVQEFYEIEGEVITDIYGTQCIRKDQISSVRLDTRPYAMSYFANFGRNPRSIFDIWVWVNSLSEEQRERIKNRYYQRQYQDL